MKAIKRYFIIVVLLLVAMPDTQAQQLMSYAVIDGRLNPPQIVSSDANIQIADSGTGRYTLTFETPVVFLLGTSLSQGADFDVGTTFFSATRDSDDRRRVSIGIFQIPLVDNAAHAQSDAVFSLKFMLLSPLIFRSDFE